MRPSRADGVFHLSVRQSGSQPGRSAGCLSWRAGSGFDAGSDTGLLRPGDHLEPSDFLVLCVLRHLWSIPAVAYGTGTVGAVAVSEREEEYLVSIDFL